MYAPQPTRGESAAATEATDECRHMRSGVRQPVVGFGDMGPGPVAESEGLDPLSRRQGDADQYLEEHGITFR